MNDLSYLEKKRKLTILHSSDSSNSSSKSNSMLKHPKSKRKKKEKLELNSTKSNNNNSYYETSDSDNEMDDKHYNKNLIVSECEDIIHKSEEERAKQKLLKSGKLEAFNYFYYILQ